MTALPSVLHICHNDNSGGAAMAAYNIHRALLAAGSTSRMLVHRKLTTDSTVQTVRSANRFILQATREHLSRRIMRKQHSMNPVLHSLNLFPSGYLKHIRRFSGCVVNLHWLGNETISIAEISRIDKPVIWTLHDMWAMCGAEHYDDPLRPGRFMRGYYSNTRHPDHKGWDIDRWMWERKRRHLADKPLIFVAPSRWMANCVRQSQIFGRHRIEVIPYSLDRSRFRPIDRRAARQLLGIDPDRRVIVFGALYGTRDRRKGFHLLETALHQLVDAGWGETTDLLVFGMSAPRDPPALGMRVHFTGHLSDDISLSVVYSAGDVMVVPSVIENLAQTALEAMACGTPVVAFDGTGTSDIVDHEVNGYLARPNYTEDLRDGIAWVVSDADRHRGLSVAARKKIERAFSPRVVAQRYLDLYADAQANKIE